MELKKLYRALRDEYALKVANERGNKTTNPSDYHEAEHRINRLCNSELIEALIAHEK